jgi:hypothetical protein
MRPAHGTKTQVIVTRVFVEPGMARPVIRLVRLENVLGHDGECDATTSADEAVRVYGRWLREALRQAAADQDDAAT